MKKRLLKLLVDYNGKIFPYLVTLVEFTLFLEVITYRGFVREYLLVDSMVLFVFAILSGLIVVYRAGKTKDLAVKSNLINFVFIVNKLLFLPMIIFYYFLISLESRHYRNYVFSMYHINLENFLLLMIFNIYLLFVQITVEKKRKRNFVFPKPSFGNLAIFMLIFFFILFEIKDIDSTLRMTVGPAREALLFSRFDRETRLRKKFGFLYDYAQFIKENTPDNSTILIPPQDYPWPMTGNVLYFRYFLYPRQLLNGGVYELGENFSEEIDFVLLAKGELKIEGKYDYGWPKVEVNADKIIVIQEFKADGAVVSEEKTGPYNPEKNDYLGKWGLIVLDKEGVK